VAGGVRTVASLLPLLEAVELLVQLGLQAAAVAVRRVL
jgi:hypothetical protein